MCENCDKDRDHVQEMYDALPEIATLNKALEWDRDNNAKEELLTNAVLAWSNASAHNVVDGYMSSATREDGMDMRTATARFGGLMMRIGFISGVLTSDWYRDRMIDSQNVSFPHIEATQDEIREFVEKEERAAAEAAETPNLEEVQTAIRKTLEGMGINPEHVLMDLSELAASASQQEENSGKEEPKTGFYL